MAKAHWDCPFIKKCTNLRVPTVLGIDLLGNTKINPLIIFKGKSNRTLKNIPQSDFYELSYQKKAWCIEVQFIKFLSLLPKNKKILLICDNFKGHKTDTVIEFLDKKIAFCKNDFYTSKHNSNFTTIRRWC